MTLSSTMRAGTTAQAVDGRLASRISQPSRAVQEAVIQPRRDASARIVVVSANALVRTCLMHCLTSSESGLVVEGYGSVEAWRARGGGTAIVLLCSPGEQEMAKGIERAVRSALAVAPGSRVVVISDPKPAGEVSRAIEQGASGFIVTDSSVDVAIAAIRLVRSGGIFVPSHSVVQSQAAPAPTAGASSLRGKVTAKQLEVIGLIRKGLPNKLIAAELEMSEFTVKVHVRNIMKRLKARNRTEVAALTNAFFAPDGDAGTDGWF